MDQNRKTRITKRTIREALIELLQTYPLSDISVTALCDHADVNRSTFYSHYENLYGVLDEIEQGFLQHVSYIRGNATKEKNLRQFDDYMEYIAQHRDEFLALLSNGRIVEKVALQALSIYKEENPNADPEMLSRYTFFIQYACAGTYQMLRHWLEQPQVYSPQTMSSIIYTLSVGIDKIEPSFHHV